MPNEVLRQGEARPMAYEHSTREQQERMDEIMDRDRAKRKGYWLMPDGVLTFIETEPARVQEEKGYQQTRSDE